MNGHLEGAPQPYLGDFRSPWLLTTYPSPGMILQVLGGMMGIMGAITHNLHLLSGLFHPYF